MNYPPQTGPSGLFRAALFLLSTASLAPCAVTFADIPLWAGAPAGPGISQAALVIDFRDGSPALFYGYRWPSQETRTGMDMMNAILGADPALTVDSVFFPNSFTHGARSRTFSNNGTPANYLDDSYWGYWVNNSVFYHPTDYNLNGHIIPPAQNVVPLGNPYAGGPWVESSTGSAARPLADGSWDGWAYGVYGTLPGSPVPESSTLWLLAAGGFMLLRRRK